MDDAPILVTGATGLVGHAVMLALTEQGKKVRALVRSPEKGRRWLPEGGEWVEADLGNRASLEEAFEGVDTVFHAAGIPEQWLSDSRQFHQVNVKGTANMIDAALNAKVTRFVYVSTIDVFAAEKGALFDETKIDPNAKGTIYEQSKQDADRLVVQAMNKSGLPAIFVHPAAVYGPGPTDSPGINDLIVKLHHKKVPLLLPGGMPLVYTEDLARGIVAASEQGEIGERFIFSESYYTLSEIARKTLDMLGRDLEKTPPMMPVWVGKLVALTGEGIAGITKKPPLVPRGQLHFLQWGAVPISEKAKLRLAWKPRTLEKGMAQTIAWLKEQGMIPG